MGNGRVEITDTATVQSTSYGQAIVIIFNGKVSVSGNAALKSASSHGTVYIDRSQVDSSLLKITGGTIENSGSGYAIKCNTRNAVTIPGGTSVIKGNGAVSNACIDLGGYNDVRVMASETSRDGKSGVEEIHPGWLKVDSYGKSYKYLNSRLRPTSSESAKRVYQPG